MSKKPPIPEFEITEDSEFSIEWYAGNTSVLTVTFDGQRVRFSAATGGGVTSSGSWIAGDTPPQSFIDVYRSVALQNNLHSDK